MKVFYHFKKLKIIYSSCSKILKAVTFAGFALSLFTKLILPNVVQMFSRNASSLLQGTTGKFSGGDLKSVSRFMYFRNSVNETNDNQSIINFILGNRV